MVKKTNEFQTYRWIFEWAGLIEAEIAAVIAVFKEGGIPKTFGENEVSTAKYLSGGGGASAPLLKVLPYLLLAREIYVLLEGPPESPKERDRAALTLRQYAQHQAFPSLSDFCRAQLMPEAWFNALLAFKNKQRQSHEFKMLCQWMMKKPNAVFVEFMQLSSLHLKVSYKDLALPSSKKDVPLIYYVNLYRELVKEPPALSWEHAFYVYTILSRDNPLLLPQFLKCIDLEELNSIKNQDDFNSLVHGLSKKLSMSASSLDFILWFKTVFSNLICPLYDFYVENEHYHKLILNACILPKLNVMKADDAWLKEKGTIEMINGLTTDRSLLMLQMNAISSTDVKYAYLTNVIGHDLLIAYLETPEDVAHLLCDDIAFNSKLADFLGVDVLKSFYPYNPGQSIQKQLTNRLPEDCRAAWLEKLMPEAERSAKLAIEGLMREVAKTEFSVGVLGVGGEVVTINGVSKSVPKHVGRMCKSATKASGGEISYEAAKAEIVAQKERVLGPSTGGLFSTRAPETDAFYKSIFAAP